MAYQERPASTIFKTKLTANDSTPQETLGAIRELEDGRKFRYVKMTGGAGAIGQCNGIAAAVAITNLTQSTVTGPDGASTSLITDSDAAWTPDAYVGYYFKTDTGKTGTPDSVKIVANTVTTLTLERALSGTAMAAGGTDDGEIIAPISVAAACTANDLDQPVSGIGIGTITQNYYGWLQIKGMCNVIGDTISEGEAICPGGNAAGQVAVNSAATETVIGYIVATSGDNEMALAVVNIA